MRAARIHRYGDASVIAIEDVECPKPGAGQVLVRVAATSFNPSEVALRSGALQGLVPVELPATLGTDVAGTVAELGDGVDSHTIGDRVIGWIGGAAAEFAVCDAAILVAAPTAVALADAAALPLAGLTAWQAVQRCGLVAGERLLVNGGGGAIGRLAVQLAVRTGARVIATAGPRSARVLTGLGIEQLIDYTITPLDEAIAAPVDVALNLIGRLAPRTAAALRAAVRPGGRIVSAAAPVAAPAGVTATHFVARNDAAQLAALVALVDRGALRVDVAEHHPLDYLPTVHRRCEAGDIHGKIIIDPAG